MAPDSSPDDLEVRIERFLREKLGDEVLRVDFAEENDADGSCSTTRNHAQSNVNDGWRNG
jgi:hypothetical protein